MSLYRYVSQHARIGKQAVIGANVYIGPNVTIGDDVKIDSGAVIGHDGFGYVHNPDGTWTHREHTFGVEIASDVHIGALTNIHQGSHRPTRIGRGSRVDAGVHVAHNVWIGEDCVIVSGVGLGGSVTVGDGAWVGLNSCVHQRLTIGDRALVGMGAVVLKDVPADQTWAGNPARCIREHVGLSTPTE